MYGGSRLLDGIWSHSGDGGLSLFELFNDGGDGDRVAAVSDVTSASDVRHDVKYYTPFGSGVSLGDITHYDPAKKSCWSAEPSDSYNGVIRKPLQMNGTDSGRICTGTTPSDVRMKTKSRHLEECAGLGRSVEQSRSGGQREQDERKHVQQRETVADQSLSGRVSNFRAVKSPSPKSMGFPGDGKYVAGEQQEKQLMASQQMFMRELNRLPPDLRKQYVDYMIASHLGLLPAACPTPLSAVPAVYCNVAVPPGPVPVTQLFAHPVVLASPLMSTPLVSLQPIVPSPATKSVSR